MCRKVIAVLKIDLFFSYPPDSYFYFIYPNKYIRVLFISSTISNLFTTDAQQN